MRKKEGCVSLVSSKRESFTGKTSIGLYSPFFEDSRSLRGTEERTGNSKGIAEPMKITFLMEPNLILNISLPLSLPSFFSFFLFFETNQIFLFPLFSFSSSSSLMQNPSSPTRLQLDRPNCRGVFLLQRGKNRANYFERFAALKRIWGVIFVCLLPENTLRDAFKILTRIAKTGIARNTEARFICSLSLSHLLTRRISPRPIYIYTYITRYTFERVRLSATLCTITTIITTATYVYTRRTCPRTFRHTELRGQKEIDRVVLISRIQQTAPSASRSFLSNFTLLHHPPLLTPISRFLLHRIS